MQLPESVSSDWGFVWSPRCYSAFPRLIYCTDKTALIPLLRMTHRIDYCSSPPLCVCVCARISVCVCVCVCQDHTPFPRVKSQTGADTCDHSCSSVMSEAPPQGLCGAWSWSLDVDSWFTVWATQPRFVERGHMTSNQVNLSELNIVILQ